MTQRVVESPREFRVTHVVFDLNGGGLETLVAEMARFWRGTNVRMSVITLSGRAGRVGEAVRLLVDQFHVRRPIGFLSMIAPLGLARAIRATRPDVVHLHSGAWYKPALAALLAGAPRVVYTEHGREHDDPIVMRWLDRIASGWTDRVIAVSERLSEYMVRVVRINRTRVVTIPNGVDTSVFEPGPASREFRASLAIPEDALVLGSIGRLEPVKAYTRLVEAYARLRRTDFGRPLLLVIVGEGSDRAELEALVERLGVGDGVRLPGWIERPIDGYRLLDVFALTSLSEGMSVSLMEAMSCGVCPVVMDVGSNAEVLGPTLADQVVPDGALDSFVRAVGRALASPEHRAQSGARARAHALAQHSLGRMLDAYEMAYRGEPRSGAA